MLNGLRDRVVLRVDGGLKTGYDVIMGSLLGADEFGFGTIAMIAEGCIMARICHTNSCPVGVTTQREALRKKQVIGEYGGARLPLSMLKSCRVLSSDAEAGHKNKDTFT